MEISSVNSILNNYNKAFGSHCISQALMEIMFNRSDLFDQRIYNEAMFFGLDASLDFVYKELGKNRNPHIFIGGRKTIWLDTFSKVTNISIIRKTGKDNKKAWELLTRFLDEKIPVLLEVDKFQINYWKEMVGPEDYGGHLIVAIAYDDDGIYVSDQCRSSEKFMKVSKEELEIARSNQLYWKPPENSYYTFDFPGKLPDIKYMIKEAIITNSQQMLNGKYDDAYTGLYAMKLFANNLMIWEDILNYDITSYRTGEKVSAFDYELFKIKKLIHEGGIGGGGNFRYLYAEFLSMCKEITKIDKLEILANKMICSGDLWKRISEIIIENEINEYKHSDKYCILQSIQKCILQIYDVEQEVFSELATLFN